MDQLPQVARQIGVALRIVRLTNLRWRRTKPFGHFRQFDDAKRVHVLVCIEIVEHSTRDRIGLDTRQKLGGNLLVFVGSWIIDYWLNNWRSGFLVRFEQAGLIRGFLGGAVWRDDPLAL